MGTRVPMMMCVPGASGNGSSCYRIVESLDIYPTIVELCGLTLPEGVEGKSLAPLLHNPAAAWDRPAYSVWSEDGRTLHGVAVRNEHGGTPNLAPTARTARCFSTPRPIPWR